MNSLQIITELCEINTTQAKIIAAQAAALEQLGAVCMEEERAEVERRFTALIGRNETPDM